MLCCGCSWSCVSPSAVTGGRHGRQSSSTGCQAGRTSQAEAPEQAQGLRCRRSSSCKGHRWKRRNWWRWRRSYETRGQDAEIGQESSAGGQEDTEVQQEAQGTPGHQRHAQGVANAIPKDTQREGCCCGCSFVCGTDCCCNAGIGQEEAPSHEEAGLGVVACAVGWVGNIA